MTDAFPNGQMAGAASRDGAEVASSDTNTRDKAMVLSDLVACIEGDGELSPTRRRDLVSCVKRWAAIHSLDLVTFPATFERLRSVGKGFDPRPRGIDHKTYSNIHSGVSAAIRDYGASPHPRGKQGLTQQWQKLWDLLPKGELRWGMSRFIGYCSEHGIGPADVDDDVAEKFGEWLAFSTPVKEPHRLLKRCIRHWNTAASSVDGWPPQHITIISELSNYVLPMDALHPELRKEIEAWLAIQANPDPLDFHHPPKPASQASLEAWQFQFRQIVSALVIEGADIGSIRGLSQFIELQNAKTVLRFYYERFGSRATQTTSSIAWMLVKIGRHWCRRSDEELKDLIAWRRNMSVSSNGLSERNRARLRQFADRRNIEKFLMLPIDVMNGLKGKKKLNRRDALDLQVALMVELLLMCPLRRKNIVSLRIGPGGHFHHNSDRHGTTHIVVTGDMVKNGQAIEAPLPAFATQLLELYLKSCRRILSDEPGQWLFPGGVPDTHKSLDHVSRFFPKTIRRLTGLDVNLHLMRHLGAYLYLDRQPGNYEVVRRVLGHKQMSTTVNRYTGLETDAAFRHYDSVIDGIRSNVLAEAGNGQVD